MIVSHLERINARNRNTIKTAQTVQKQKSLANLHKTTVILFKCHKSIAKSIHFYFLLLSWKSSLLQKVQSWKFKTLLWISNHDPLCWMLNNINFYLSTFPAMVKLFKIKKKTLFWDHFCPKGTFPKSSS